MRRWKRKAGFEPLSVSRFLADACALVVYFGAGDAGASLGAEGLAAMDGGDVAVSPITVWEISRKMSLGKLRPLVGAESVASSFRRHGFTLHPLAWEDAEHANTLPAFHKDPMDRMLIAQALRGDMTIITDDAVFARYGVKTLW